MSQVEKETEKRVLELYRKSLVIEGLALIIPIPGTEIKQDFFDQVIKAGIDIQHLTVIGRDDTAAMGLRRMNMWHDMIEKYPNKYALILTVEDIKKAKSEGKLGLILGTQNSTILEGNLDMLSVYKRFGLRVMGLSYYGMELTGDGCAERTNGGLTMYGVDVVKEMNRLGIVIDLSHSGDQQTLDAIKFSDDPVIFSHANPRALCNNIRNKTDEAIKAMADKGGVLGVNAWGVLCERKVGRIPPTMDDCLDMIDYVVKLVGVDHVAYGLDHAPYMGTEGGEMSPEEWAKQYPDIVPKRFIGNVAANAIPVERLGEATVALAKRGYKDSDIEKIIGGNWLRLFSEVWHS